jgi:aspartate aminotransferase-like enzyme
VRAEILAECARPMIGHRSSHMAALIERIDPPLRRAFGLAAESSSTVAVHTSSATGLMELCLRALSGRVLCVVGGEFARRWFQIAQALGLQAHALEVPMGGAASALDLARALDQHGPFEAVTAVVNETSTGVRTRPSELARGLREHPSTMLFVDVVTYLAGASVDFDAHRIDFALAGSQKALALPPGLSLLCASARFLERARSSKSRSFYLDPLRVIDGHTQRKTPATPCIPLYYALARQLEDIEAGVTLPHQERHLRGLDAWRARYEKHERMQACTAAWCGEHELKLLPAPEHASPTISCIRTRGFDAALLVAGLKERGFEISNGYGDLKGATSRIGHMGDHTEQGLADLLSAAHEVLAQVGRGRSAD